MAEVAATTTTVRKPFGNLDLGEDDDEEDDNGEMAAMVKMKKKKRKQQQRRRRRSSARFLRLGASQQDDDDDDEEEEAAPESEQLGELYKRAIRMNAENRINAGNSWNLKLIENIDRLIINEDAVDTTSESTVNFTKASCTLDASVKIYSYRVDDVHLTSYKVLANLNRNDVNMTSSSSNSKNNDDGGDAGDDVGSDEIADNNPDEGTKARRSADTLESNIANLNLNKLDSAYDIDPLFHKMSKTFDEGGAKGLLLVNLGVGSRGCNIVFDSKEEEKVDYSDGLEGMVDITGLTAKLDSLMSSTPLETLELVPQLRTLRQEYAVLEDEGFITHDEKKSRRYATSQEEEKEAEMSIHQDFLERSRMSAATGHMSSAGGDSSIVDAISHAAADDDNIEADVDEYGADDYGGDDDDDDFGFDAFISNDANGERYSSISFQNEPFLDAAAGATQTAALLDALCSSEMSQNDYEFFSQDTLEKLSQGNDWAGSQHWKKASKLRKKEIKPKTTKKKAGKKKKKQSTIDFSADASQIDELLKPAQKNKRGTDPTQLSKAMKTKYAKADNILPLDAGMGIDQLSKLFLRPTAVVRTSTAAKTVGFHETVSYGFDDGSCGGDDDDGPGFEFAGDDYNDDDDFVVAKLDVRKVQKVHVGYATVAKKVDVKRLKKDLWSELETNFGDEPKDDVEEEEKKEEQAEGDDEVAATKNNAPQAEISFKETIQEMDNSQKQTDVSLPFYFICLLHLANEKGLRLDSEGLTDFKISQDNGSTIEDSPAAEVRSKRAKETVDFTGMEEEE